MTAPAKPSKISKLSNLSKLSKKNRNIALLAAISFLLLLVLFFRERRPESGLETSAAEATSEEQFGDKVASSGAASNGANELMPILNQISTCLHLSTRAETSVPFTIESVFDNFQSELGAVSHQADRSMRWDLRELDGKIKRLQLVITENDEGQVGRELHAFSLDSQGNATPQETEPSLAVNPPDDRIHQMLKEGEVIDKDRSAVAFFPTGGRVEYIEKNGVLSQLQFFQGQKSVRCDDLKQPSSCQCL